MPDFDEDNRKPENNIHESAAIGHSDNGIANELAKQLSDFAQNKKILAPSDDSHLSQIGFDRISSAFGISDKERAEGLKQVGNSLDAMVKGDIPHLKERMKELGLSTKELDAVEKQLTAKVEAAKPVEEAILKGDSKALQKMVATMDPKQLAEVSELIQKHFDKSGMGLEVDYTDGKLIISQTNGDKGVAISGDKMELIGVNKDGSYDFNRHFRHANPGNELKSFGDNALSNYLYPPRSFKEFSVQPILDNQIYYKNASEVRSAK